MSSFKTNMLKASFLSVCMGLASVTAFAAPTRATGVLDPLNPCTAGNWQITGATPSSVYAGTVPTLTTPISATSCAGIYTGNDGPALNPSPNLGYLNDGLLNGQFGLLSSTQFISSSQLQALKDPTKPVDPGWVMLGQMNQNAGSLNYSTVTPVGKAAFSFSDVIKYTQTQTSNVGGAWLLEIDKDIVSKLTAAGLFERSNFDHLAFEVKSNNNWAVYDFDFNLINAASGGAFNLNIPYTLAGTWTMNGDFEQDCKTDKKTDVVTCSGIDQDISHMSVWARDPVSSGSTVPLPGTVFLMGLGLIALGAIERRSQKA